MNPTTGTKTQVFKELFLFFTFSLSCLLTSKVASCQTTRPRILLVSVVPWSGQWSSVPVVQLTENNLRTVLHMSTKSNRVVRFTRGWISTVEVRHIPGEQIFFKWIWIKLPSSLAPAYLPCLPAKLEPNHTPTHRAAHSRTPQSCACAFLQKTAPTNAFNMVFVAQKRCVCLWLPHPEPTPTLTSGRRHGSYHLRSRTSPETQVQTYRQLSSALPPPYQSCISSRKIPHGV